MALTSIQDILKFAEANKQRKCVVVAASEDDHALEAVVKATREGFVDPILVGDQKKTEELLEHLGADRKDYRFVPTESAAQSAFEAVQAVRRGEAQLMMKGKLNTSDLLRAVLNKETGLPHEEVVTVMALTEVKGYHKLLALNDCAIIPYPSLHQKTLQIRMVTQAMHRLGYGDDLKVAVICPNENVNPKMIESVEAAELKRMNQAGEITGCIVEGPISLDIALIKENAEAKGFSSPVAGNADLLLFPNLCTGNVYAKAIEMTGVDSIGIVLGAGVPIVLPSRTSPAKNKYNALVAASTIA